MKTLEVSKMENVQGGWLGIGGRYESCIDMGISLVAMACSSATYAGIAWAVVNFGYFVSQAAACEGVLFE